MQLKVPIILILFLTGLNGIIAVFFKPLIYLNENQILYSTSTIAQVIAGLFGLILAAYAIIDPNLKEIGSRDQKALDYVDLQRKIYFQNIIVLSIMCAATIVLCLTSLNLYTFLSEKWFSFFITETILSGLSSIALFLYFGCSLLNPNSLAVLSKADKKEIENSYSSTNSDEDFKPFVAYYNKLESLILEFATEIMEKELNQKQDVKLKNGRIQLFQSLEILGMKEIINREIYDKIDELRRYRNALVHSTDDQTVNPQIFNDLKELYLRLYDVYENKDNENLKVNAIKNLYNYGHQILLTDLDRKILNFINEHAGTSIEEISYQLQLSKTVIIKILKKLQAKGKITQESDGYYITQ